MSTRRKVSLVTLGCARNEVDSEELAARLEAGGCDLVDGRRRRRRRGGQHLRVHRGGQEGLDRHRCSQAADLSGGRPGRGRGRLPGRAVRRASSPSRCPRPTRSSASTTTPTSPTRLDDDPRRRAHVGARPARPAHAAAARPGGPGGRRRGRARPGAPSTDPTCRTGVAPASGPRVAAAAARRRPGRAAQAGLRLRPALHVLRHPGLPRRVRVAAARRGAGRGALARRAGRARAGPGQRELHLLRQGPRRPAAAGDGCSRSSPRSTASTGSGSATCSPPRCGPG